MKVAIASAGDSLDAPTDPRFGRCAMFVVVDTDSMGFEVLENAAAMQGSGAGIAAAQMVANAGAEAVVAGNYGPNAFQGLSAGGLKLYSGVFNTVREAVEAVKSGQLEPLEAPSVGSKFGMGQGGGGMAGGMGPGMGAGMGGGMGMGRGMGRGMGGGMGMGRGMGRGMGAGMGRGMMSGPMAQQPPPQGASLEALKAQAEALAQQLEDIKNRITEMEKGDE